MQILLIAATQQEIQPAINANYKIDVLITGVGIPSTIYHLQKRVYQVKYDLILQAGIAGSYRADLYPGQTVAVKQDCFGDLGMEENENFASIFGAGFADRDEYPFEDAWMVNRGEIIDNINLHQVKAVTVNKVSDSLLQKQQLQKMYNADVETMEGAALHYVCLKENLPFLQVRSVSNFVGERDKTKWNFNEAVINLNTALVRLISQLTVQL